MTKLFGNQTELPKEAEDQHKKKKWMEKKKKSKPVPKRQLIEVIEPDI